MKSKTTPETNQGIAYYVALSAGMSPEEAIKYRDKCVENFDNFMSKLNHERSDIMSQPTTAIPSCSEIITELNSLRSMLNALNEHVGELNSRLSPICSTMEQPLASKQEAAVLSAEFSNQLRELANLASDINTAICDIGERLRL